MRVVGLDHLQLAIPAGGEDDARQFFAGLLEMRELSKPANLAPGGCWFESGSLRLHIGVDPDFRPATKAHPALLVDDLASLRAKLGEGGSRSAKASQSKATCACSSTTPSATGSS